MMIRIITIILCGSILGLSNAALATTITEKATQALSQITKEALPKEYQDEVQNIENIRKHYNAIAPNKPEEIPAHIKAIKDNAVELGESVKENAVELGEAVKDSKHVNKNMNVEDYWAELKKITIEYYNKMLTYFDDKSANK